MVGGVLAVVGLAVLALDLSLAARDKASSPERTLKAFFKAIPMGRFGYSWAMLCPTAREQTVSSPKELGPSTPCRAPSRSRASPR